MEIPIDTPQPDLKSFLQIIKLIKNIDNPVKLLKFLRQQEGSPWYSNVLRDFDFYLNKEISLKSKDERIQYASNIMHFLNQIQIVFQHGKWFSREKIDFAKSFGKTINYLHVMFPDWSDAVRNGYCPTL